MRTTVLTTWLAAVMAPLLIFAADPGPVEEATQDQAAWKELRRIPVPPEYPRVSYLRLSPDGQRVAYVATWQREEETSQATIWTKKSALFVDGDRVTSDDYYVIHSPSFSPDGNHIGYVTVTPVGNQVSTASWRVHVDQRTLPGQGATSPPVFSPDAQRLAWLADVSPSLLKPRTALYVDGAIVSEEVERPVTWSMNDLFEMDSEPIVAFSPDGTRVAFNAKLGKKHALVVNGRDITPEAKVIGPPKFSPDGRVVYQAKVKGGWCLMIDDHKATAVYDKIGKPVFSRDGSIMAFRAQPKKKWAVFVDGRQVTPEFDRIGPIALSADGSTVAYPVRIDKRWTVYINDRQLAVDLPGPTLGHDGIRALALNADGTRVAFVYEILQDDELDYYGVPESSFLMVNETQTTHGFTALDFVVVEDTAITFAGHDPTRHEIVVGTLPFVPGETK